MSVPEVPAVNMYATMDSASHELARVLDIPDDVRLFAVEIAGDTLTLDDEEVIHAVMDLDDAAFTSDRVTNEVIRYGKLGDTYKNFIDRLPETSADSSESDEALALNHLRAGLAARRFRVEFPDRMNCSGDGYYSSQAFSQGTVLAFRLISDYLAMQK